MIAALLLAAGTVAAQAPVIREIEFAGNDTTQARTMARELTVHVGDPADADAIERSRQAIQDLGLFRSVSVEQVPVDGGVCLRFTVLEKWYFIPAPRADSNSDGQYAYGAQLRWYNAWGLDHTVKATIKRENRQEAGRGIGLSMEASYDMPHVLDGDYDLELSASRRLEPVDEPSAYDELQRSARAVVSRKLDHTYPASQGWRAGAGLQWLSQRTLGPDAPPRHGDATALVLKGSFVDQRFNLYSEAGRRFSAEFDTTLDELASDYGYARFTLNGEQSWYVGQTPHQSVALFGQIGIYDGGPPGAGAHFQLGGSDSLRGYRHNFREGDSSWYAGAEFLRPLHWDWLRGVAFVEAGNTCADGTGVAREGGYADVGLGLRLRATWFVHFELNLGLALPLVDPGNGDGTGPRFFATGRR